MLGSAVLLLNQNYTPLTTCSARRAIIMVWLGKAEIVESTGLVVRSVTMTFDIPAIIRLLMYVGISYKWNIQLTKQNILRRDHKTCQYCGENDGPMTVDHIIPRSHGGEETWGNLVCACSACNNKKGNRTPQTAGMILIKQPKKPNIRTFLFHNKGHIHSTWRTYLKIY
ncbi:MAG: HNH endonuclease [Candidatus Latescibacteria bacterium]|jgi:5-methylcytosine-specific restriction endonuclease McrA|nr:HNH endonuclease [Candidatus Latescibacterota bacterium]